MGCQPVPGGFLSRASNGRAVAALCAALLIRAVPPLAALAWTGGGRAFHAPDTASYLACAESLARGDGFAAGGEPEIYRTPGFPLLLVPGVLAGRPAAVTIPLQVALGSLTAWLVYRLAWLLSSSRRAALAAMALFAVEPLSVLYCGILLSETLFAAALTLAALLLARRASGGGRGSLVGAALALSASAYVRPVSYWLPLPAAAYLLWAGRRRGARRAALGAGAFLAICAALTGAWRVRNRVETGYGGFSAVSDAALYYYHGAAVEAASSGESYYDVRRRMCSGEDPRRPAIDPGPARPATPQRYAGMAAEGLAIIRAHPMAFGAIYAKGLARTLLDPGAADWLKYLGFYREGGGLLGETVDRGLARTVLSLPRRHPGVFWTGLGLGLLLLAYLVAAAAGLLSRPGPGAGAPALALAYILLLSGGPNALARFRHPAMPLFCVFAGIGLEAAARGRRGAEVQAAPPEGANYCGSP